MNDKFLYQSRPPLRSEFEQELYARISRHPETKHEAKGSSRKIKVNVLQWALRTIIAIALALSLTLLFSKDARATLSFLIKEIAGFFYEETDKFPFPDHPEGDYQRLPEYELTQAQSILPFSLILPSYLPEGYSESGTIATACDNACALVTWHNETQNTLTLLIQLVENYPEWAEPVGLETVEEISFDGNPAALIRGAWDFETEQWNEKLALRLRWESDGLVYSLSWRPPNSGRNLIYKLPLEELIQIAQSINSK